MTTNPVSRLYDRLTPRERLPLLIAAAKRGDAIESQRLQMSAPKLQLEMPDYYPHADAWNEVAHYHLLTVLDLGLHFWQWWGLWLTRGLRNQITSDPSPGQRGQGTAAKNLERRAGFLVSYYAARFVAHIDGWKQFCNELHVDPQALLDFMIGWDHIVRTESQARELAFTPEDARWFVRFETIAVDGDESKQRGPDPVETPAEVAAGWRAIYAQLVSQKEGD
jgi:hypothetical protein